jgi:hypothetical protein
MTPLESRDRWGHQGDRLLAFLPFSLQGVRIPEDARAYLLTAGLPEDAAPCLSFKSPKTGPLPTVADEWHLGPTYNRYRVIGFNGSGDPICLDESEEGAVVYLNHDDRFRPVLINQAVSQLAESLLTFRQFIQQTNARFGDDASIDGNIPPDLLQWVEGELRRIDQRAFQPNCFWLTELRALDSMKGK